MSRYSSYFRRAAKEVEVLLKNCSSAGGKNIIEKSTGYPHVFIHKFKYVCTSCPTTTSPHYIKLPPTNQAQDSQVFCENDTEKYRVLTKQEKVWFRDTSQVNEYIIFLKFFILL